MSTKRIVAGTLVSYLNTGISMISNFILVPMYLYYLGKEQYGLWIVVLSIVNYLGLSNLGIAQIVSNLVASANSKRDYDGVRTIVATGFWLYVAIISVVSLFVVGAAIFAPLGNLFKVSGSLERVITPVFVISSVFFLLQLPLTIFRVTLRSLNLIYKEQLFGIVFTIIQFAGVLVILLLKIGIIGLSIVYGAVGVLSGIILFIYLRKIVPGISAAWKFIDLKLVRELIKPGVYFFILQLSAGLIFGTDNIIIGAVLGAAAVAPYAVAFRFLIILSGLAGVFTSNMLPAITASHALNDRQYLSDIYMNALRICFGFGLLVVPLLISVGPDLMIKWVGADNYVGNPTFYIFICLIFILVILWPSDAILMGTTKHIGYAKMAVFEGVINISLSLWWIRIWGVVGVASATLAARLATNGWFMFYSAFAITGVEPRELIIKIIKPFIIPVSGALVMVYILSRTPLVGWYKITVGTISICLVFIALQGLLSLYNKYNPKL